MDWYGQYNGNATCAFDLLQELLLRFGAGWGKIYHEYVCPAAPAGRLHSGRELR